MGNHCCCRKQINEPNETDPYNSNHYTHYDENQYRDNVKNNIDLENQKIVKDMDQDFKESKEKLFKRTKHQSLQD